ncbi:MAG: hypothetical protein ABI432_03630 [Flavobacteriales bacterium]
MGFKDGFALSMSAVYVICGILVGFTAAARDLIPHYRPGIAAVLIGYGFLRFFLWWRKRKNEGGPA